MLLKEVLGRRWQENAKGSKVRFTKLSVIGKELGRVFKRKQFLHDQPCVKAVKIEVGIVGLDILRTAFEVKCCGLG